MMYISNQVFPTKPSYRRGQSGDKGTCKDQGSARLGLARAILLLVCTLGASVWHVKKAAAGIIPITEETGGDYKNAADNIVQGRLFISEPGKPCYSDIVIFRQGANGAFVFLISDSDSDPQAADQIGFGAPPTAAEIAAAMTEGADGKVSYTPALGAPGAEIGGAAGGRTYDIQSNGPPNSDDSCPCSCMVPEPTTLHLLASGLLALSGGAACLRRRKSG